MDRKFRYCVLCIFGTEQQKFINILNQHIPEGRGEAFYPCMEYYRRDKKETMIKPIFPGYIFLYTDLNVREVHELVLNHRAKIRSGIRELALANERMDNENSLFSKDDEDAILDLSDVDEEEKEFLDQLRLGNGLLTMSSGYEVVEKIRKKGGKADINRYWVVMEGPLKVYEKRIVKVDKHERRAYLEFKINGNHAQAGFNCLPKSHWLPDKKARIAKLSDGVEVDLDELQKSIMTV